MKYFKYTLTIGILVILTGCATTSLQQAPDKNASIAVMSMLGNKAHLNDNSFFRLAKEQRNLKGMNLDNELADTIGRSLKTHGRENVTVCQLPLNNPIAAETWSKFYFRLGNVKSWETDYIKKQVSHRHFDYIITVFPNGYEFMEKNFIFRYGIYNTCFFNSRTTRFYAAYCINIFNGHTFDLLSNRCHSVHNDHPSFKMVWKGKATQLTNKQWKAYKTWLSTALKPHVVKTVLNSLAIS